MTRVPDDGIDLTGPVERASQEFYKHARPNRSRLTPEWDELSHIDRHAIREMLTPIVHAAFNGDSTVRYVEVPR